MMKVWKYFVSINTNQIWDIWESGYSSDKTSNTNFEPWFYKLHKINSLFAETVNGPKIGGLSNKILSKQTFDGW